MRLILQANLEVNKQCPFSGQHFIFHRTNVIILYVGVLPHGGS